ncbi:MAG: DUF1015 family protein [Gammaproteobacteria bacterium]|nr:DUF1015 family protein [Gammaproteobacteria bacterium]
MSLILPLKGLRPAPGRADDVVAPPYDVLNTAEARQRAQGRPWSFLHISKPEIDLPEGTDPFDASVYAKGKENFDHMLAEGVLVRDPEPYYYVYRLVMGEHEQTGLVTVASVKNYDSNRIRKHEFTRPDKEDDRVRQVDALNAQTGPVFLTYRHNKIIDDIVAEAVKAEPEVDVTADNGVRHTLWVMRDAAQIKTITDTFDAMDCLYIADGHHRSAAGSRVAAMRAEANSNHTGDESYNYFLSVVFPDNQMKILDYNRVITDLNGLDQAGFMQQVEQAFEVTGSAEAVKPAKATEFGMYLDGQWYRLSIKANRIPADPVGCLDVSLLQNNLIAPILGIDDPRRDKRIDFVGGIRGLQELERRVDSGEMKVAFSLFATSMDALMAVADANEVMPPKSTWFEPKLADGLVSHVLD